MRLDRRLVLPAHLVAAGAALTALCLVPAVSRAHSAPEADPSAAEPAPATLEELAPNLFRLALPERLHTVMLALTGDDGLLLVDYENPDLESFETDEATRERIDPVLASLDAGPVRYLINTHWHADHVGGNVAFGDQAVIVAHRAVRARLAERQTPWWMPEGIGPMAAAGLPDITYSAHLRLHLNSETVELLHFGPAHTDGDTAVWFREANVVHVGDLFHGLAKPSPGGDMPGVHAFLAALLAEIPSDARIVTGHGPVVPASELGTYVEMLGDTLAWVGERKAAGATLEEIQAERLPPEWRARWEGSEGVLAQWLGAIFSEPRPGT